MDADGKSGDGAGIKLEISPDFFNEKVESTGHTRDETKDFVLAWFSCLEMIMEIKKNVDR